LPNIDAAVLARRQKDLDGYTEAYQATLEKRVGQYADEMLPTWKRMAQKIQERAKKLYREAGALDGIDTKDAQRKIKALQYEAARLENLAADMAEDIKKVETQLQPYFTSVIKHEFENAYYCQAFGMEQAAQVAIQTPLLTPDRVLGVLANPWLQDGANYSARLRLNTADLAVKMRGVMSEAVTFGWDWNTTARRIGEVSGEGYFNAVRLARTELNRAASLGASYMMMENADILDGKRWNATLDSRTAPKDAANDGETFDLDYDTPDNPGVPGKRVPNHPNCRCKYSPVLSAQGVSAKERIARGNGDTPGNFGERT
jgi:SPP1 gp7 family putative phage head morphogenesis protein